MSPEPRFLTVAEVISIHDLEIAVAGGASGIRDLGALESAVGAPRASFAGHYLMDIFEMAATYVHSIAQNHPFMDGNKRAALATGLTFLYMNGHEVEESGDEELADKTLELVSRKITKADLAKHLRSRSREIL
jgi:death-on-curing protein